MLGKGGLTKGVWEGISVSGAGVESSAIRLRILKLRIFYPTLHERIENCQVQGIVRFLVLLLHKRYADSFCNASNTA